MKHTARLLTLGVLGGVSVPTTKTADQITGLTGWWDASDGATLFSDAGTTPAAANEAVYRMTDKSGLSGNRYMEQSTAGNRAAYKLNIQNNKSALLFDADDAYLSIAISNFMTAGTGYFFIVLKPVTTADTKYLFGDGTYTRLYQSATGASLLIYSGAYKQTAEIATTTNEALLITAWHDGGYIYIQKNNGTVSDPVACGNPDDITGAFKLLSLNTGYFFEMAVYNQTVTNADRAALNLGLCAKWGINP
jgi:hypothetical protein